jgi:hypothetical protein
MCRRLIEFRMTTRVLRTVVGCITVATQGPGF